MEIRSTTVLAVSYNDTYAIGGDGQVTFGETVMKSNARKIRRLYNDQVLAGFAGSTADALTLFEKFEGKVEQYYGKISRAAVDLAKEWRTDKILRRLEAMLIVMDKEGMYVISGNGDVIEPEEGVVGIGSGGQYAVAAAKAMMRSNNKKITAREIVEESLKIAASICIYTNTNITVEELKS
ncbi:MAG: ATP-dependent protease subunit HslV [bacterium]|nr:ATP-dependent protease subunit HslV [bacterium]